ncbi:DUF1365 domain-containing protein [Aestuariibacter sp. AA17]|uniref:DUF1365 domain-containing protein n=1 Tax=Fluctibacter corallii TaxID=2984329 RepID=A0ABT3A3E0_9ALTE|nr:DUF1365 domain-containing protein [Aestuariibacter sp. AA17]MCV2883203.1 DUF1365 domain-containing protein [Aestuariibacter sp. AA17]
MMNDSKQLESALYVGTVLHARHKPKVHRFTYRIFLFWLKLDEIEKVANQVTGFNLNGFSPVTFRRSDYLGEPDTSLQQSVLNKMSSLHGQPLEGDIFLLGQTRTLGLYFSPVNFYYLRNPSGEFTHMLAEVSNTPWNERHHYLVDLNKQEDSIKAFHVSPFNNMEMRYKWRVAQPKDTLKLHLSCHAESKEFDAALNLRKQELNSKTLFRVLVSIPSMTIKTVVGIYWQALKLWVKGMPVYPHPKS